jgi:hypothetical protein
MKLFRKIDEQGYFIEDVLFDSHPIITVDEVEVLDPHYIDTPCDGGFYKPKWNGSEWVEGKSQEEIEYEEYLESIKPTDTEIQKAERELETIDLLLELGVIE